MRASGRFDLAGRVALVTGASSGIGEATALALAEAGADVVLGVRNPDKVIALCRRIEAVGSRATVVTMDMGDLDGCRVAIDAANAETGGIDILVNNVGGGVEDHAIDVREADFDAVIGTNLKAPFFLAQKLAQGWIAEGRTGNIVNLSSQAALVALPRESVYCLAKAALSHLTRCLALEWGERGIRVNAVAPTFIETPGTAKALSDPDFREDTIERIAALKRLGRPDEVAGAIVFLVSPAASLVTGHTLVIDGGWTIR